ncbi:MAG TPA: NAD-dependent epimerase/dehydratase family protein [Acidimicrobiia bacterium]|nr:NAD-dependent epimerase/dehydratase family protein [Acidimicrobiia bacterium]
MKALVTGSAGFIGKHVSRALLANGFEVTGYDQKESTEPGVESVVGDFLDLEALSAAVEGHDVIVHIGAIGDVYLAATNPELAASVNVTGSTNIALAAEATGARVVYASTWEVYGEPVYEPVDEKHPCEPDHPYNITKLAGERMLIAADRLRDVPVVALRLGTAYGLGMRPNSVFEIFIDKARKGEPITIQGDGSQGRQFTHARDIAQAFVAAAKSDVRGIALNVVSPEMISIKQLADVVTERFPTEVTYGQPRPGDVAPSYVSAARIEEKLGWKTEVSFEEGMAELLSVDRG